MFHLHDEMHLILIQASWKPFMEVVWRKEICNWRAWEKVVKRRLEMWVRYESKVQFLHCACDYGPKHKQVASLMLMITKITERHGCAIIYTYHISLPFLISAQTFLHSLDKILLLYIHIIIYINFILKYKNNMIKRIIYWVIKWMWK